ncbi:hypothetical protein [Streptomyces sp. NPDC001833]|uniref:hypothetical protein n=1 Tax=Streptomyces sp. NPDC001833 TaxID=3154658 RepID=UPI003328F3AC
MNQLLLFCGPHGGVTWHYGRRVRQRVGNGTSVQASLDLAARNLFSSWRAPRSAMLSSKGFMHMDIGRLSSAILALSGLAGVCKPDAVAAALGLEARTSRGTVEIRAGLGGTYLALGAWAFLQVSQTADLAVAVTWLGAAAVRLVALVLDRPRTNAAYWSYLGLEVGCAAISLAAVAG